MVSNSDNAIVNNNYGRLQELILLFTIIMASSMNFFDIFRQFGHTPSQIFASPGLYYETSATHLAKNCYRKYKTVRFVLRIILWAHFEYQGNSVHGTAASHGPKKRLRVFRGVTLCRLANSYRLFLGCWILKFKHCALPKRR